VFGLRTGQPRGPSGSPEVDLILNSRRTKTESVRKARAVAAASTSREVFCARREDRWPPTKKKDTHIYVNHGGCLH